MSVNQKSYSRLLWTVQEQKLLKSLKEDQNIQSWKLIAKILNQNFPKKNRTGKQCRERYINYVRFDQEGSKMTSWTHEEDLLLFSKFIQEGPKWVKIAKNLPTKSQNCLKNRFYGLIRKIIRKIQKFYRQKNRKVRKIIRPQFFAKILESKLEINQYGHPQDTNTANFLERLRKNLIEFAFRCEQDKEESSEYIQSFIEKIQKFYDVFKGNHAGRSLKKKVITKQCQDNEKQMEQFPEGSGSNTFSKNWESAHHSSQMQQISNETASKQKIVQNIILKSPQIQASSQALPQNFNYYMLPYFFMLQNQQICLI